ncbi:hypothetical protein GWN91_07745, partial [Candidatus Saccharibacteria bacterium]|nr:hypothetical protein [Candidatus Saccharibacteria bacterium]NIW80650.1 hypothetical protein [Calditrichia bacterium]
MRIMLAEKLSAKGQPNRLFDFVLNNYFRISPSGPIHKYISAVQEQSPIRRLHFAQIYNYPEVIEALAYDIDPWVREAARNNKYWQYLGQFKQLLRMNKHDKICFIQKEHFSTLLIFIVFETDLEVLESLFQNPTISIQMLLTLRNYLKKRGKGARDTKMLKLIERTIAIKRNRVVKISEIVQQFNHSESIHPLTNILKFLLDEDPLIVQSAINALYQFEHQEVMNFLFEPNPLALDHQSNYRLLWHILDRLKIHYRVPKKDLPELSETD